MWDVERREREEDNLEATDKIRALEKKIGEIQEKVQRLVWRCLLSSEPCAGCADPARCSDAQVDPEAPAAEVYRHG